MVEAGEVQSVMENATPPVGPPSAQAPEEAQAQDDDDHIMAEIKQETKPEVKLEDLFAGMDSDDDEIFNKQQPG